MNSELKELVAGKMDVLEFMDFLNLEFEDLLDYLDPLLEENELALLKELQ